MEFPVQLNEEQRELVKHAVETNTPIIISGKQGPIGKTTLKNYLNGKGVQAFEEWECSRIDLPTGGGTSHECSRSKKNC